MNSKLRFLGGLVVPMALVVACGSSSKSNGGSGGADSGATGTGGKSSTGGASNTGGTTGGSTGGTSNPDAGKNKCDMTPCTGNSKGAPCCSSATVCGITVLGICLPLSIVNQFPGGDGGFGKAETVVPDAKCKSTSFNGYTLTGCCDISGVCGVSTAGIPPNPLISVPVQCLTPKESVMFGGAAAGASTDAGPEVPCDYPGSDAGSKTDAGK